MIDPHLAWLEIEAIAKGAGMAVVAIAPNRSLDIEVFNPGPEDLIMAADLVTGPLHMPGTGEPISALLVFRLGRKR